MVNFWPVLCLLLEPFGLLTCDDPNIVELKLDTFDSYIADNNFVMVQFYTPWCPHCKTFRIEYNTLSTRLQAEESKIKLAKVNGAVEMILSTEHSVITYPTLKFFVNGKSVEYRGQRKAKMIHEWMVRKLQPIRILDSVNDIEQFIDAYKMSVIGFFDQPNTKQMNIFRNAALHDDNDIQFAIVMSKLLRTEYGAENYQITLFKDFDDRETTFTAGFNESNLKNFFITTSTPLLIDFSLEYASKLFQHYDRKHFFIFVSETDDYFEEIKEDLRELSRRVRDQFFFIIVNMDKSENLNIPKVFNVDIGEIPTYRIVKLDHGISKFKPIRDEMSMEDIKSFLQEFLRGNIEQDLMGQKLPDDWDAGSVKILVSSNFNDIVFDLRMDVLVVFHSPLCGHCKKIEPVYNKLGEFYKNSKTVVIAKMDATQNELAHTKIQNYPTIKLYRRGTNEVSDYHGDRTLDGFISFIEDSQNLNISVNDEL